MLKLLIDAWAFWFLASLLMILSGIVLVYGHRSEQVQFGFGMTMLGTAGLILWFALIGVSQYPL